MLKFDGLEAILFKLSNIEQGFENTDWQLTKTRSIRYTCGRLYQFCYEHFRGNLATSLESFFCLINVVILDFLEEYIF